MNQVTLKQIVISVGIFVGAAFLAFQVRALEVSIHTSGGDSTLRCHR
ncbi:MAG: hypothetical protein ACK5P5_02705 [Pseudobdellovibrionaceae bacterium]